MAVNTASGIHKKAKKENDSLEIINAPLAKFNKNLRKRFGPRMTVSIEDKEKLVAELHAAACETTHSINKR
jgi:hypothetical protein